MLSSVLLANYCWTLQLRYLPIPCGCTFLSSVFWFWLFFVFVPPGLLVQLDSLFPLCTLVLRGTGSLKFPKLYRNGVCGD